MLPLKKILELYIIGLDSVVDGIRRGSLHHPEIYTAFRLVLLCFSATTQGAGGNKLPIIQGLALQDIWIVTTTKRLEYLSPRRVG